MAAPTVYYLSATDDDSYLAAVEALLKKLRGRQRPGPAARVRRHGAPGGAPAGAVGVAVGVADLGVPVAVAAVDRRLHQQRHSLRRFCSPEASAIRTCIDVARGHLGDCRGIRVKSPEGAGRQAAAA